MKSSTFASNGEIPQDYTCDDLDLSPALSGGDPLTDTGSLALILDDPDVPVGSWVHWVLCDLPTAA